MNGREVDVEAAQAVNDMPASANEIRRHILPPSPELPVRPGLQLSPEHSRVLIPAWRGRHIGCHIRIMPRSYRLLPLVVYMTLLGSACAPAAPSADTRAPSRLERRSNAFITRDELVKSTARDALTAIRALRPD